MKKKLLILLPVLLTIVGCSDSKRLIQLNLKYIPTNAIPQETLSQATQQNISDSSSSIDQSLNTLSKMKVAENPVGRFQPPQNARKMHLKRRMSINWNGPMMSIIDRIADMCHYQVLVLGNPPVQPLLVNLRMNNKPVADILRNVQYQTFHFAKIVVYPKKRKLEVRYLR